MASTVRVALALAAAALSTGTALATVSPASWRREILLGSNRDSYFVWVLRWSRREGEAYPYHDSITLERRSLVDQSTLERHEVSAARVAYDDDAQPLNRTPDLVPLFDLTSYLRENEVSPAFSDDWGCGASFRDGALVLTKGNAVATILDADEVKTRLGVWGEDARVVGGCQVVWTDEKQPRVSFYTVQLNEPAEDVDWLELVLPVPADKVRAALDHLAWTSP